MCYAGHIDEYGLEVLQVAERLELEGVAGKLADSIYGRPLARLAEGEDGDREGARGEQDGAPA